MQTFSIVLESPNNAFFANRIVNGCIIIRTEKPFKARSIDVAIYGQAKASWEHRQGKNAIQYKTVLFYIKEEFLLWKCPDTSNKLPPGEYEFPFQFFIPYDAPPNINGCSYGDVKYWINSKIDVPWGFDKSIKLEFSVCPFVDLNNDSRFTIPVIKHAQTSNSLKKITMRIPKMGYVCGESIPVHVEISNKLITTVTSVEMGVEALFDFTAECLDYYFFSQPEPRTKSLLKNYTLHNITAFPIERNYNVILTQNLCIPPLPPSYDYCGFIKIYYRVFVKLHTKARFSSGPKIDLPIVIGTVPLNEVMTEIEPCVVGDNDYIHPPMPTSIISEFNLENIQFWEEESEKELENGEICYFQPKYPFFLNFSSRPPYYVS